MLVLILSYLGGVLTIFSPCVLPVIPFVFSKSDQPFRKSGLPMLVGMALSFAIFSTLSVMGGNWVAQANQFGRALALAIFTVLGISLILPKVADQVMRPFVLLGGFLQKKADQGSGGLGSSLLLGASVGLLWAPCAGPILGLVLAGAAISGSHSQTLGLLLVFASGAATSLAVAILAGGKLLRSLKKGLGAEEWIKRITGVIVLAGVAAIALGLDTKLLSKISYFNTNRIEQSLVSKLSANTELDQGLQNMPMPSLDGANEWLNSKPLTQADLKGKVVLIDFWTYSCINCLRTLPHLKAWAEKYKDRGLVVIGVHAPEFAFEKDIENVKKAVVDLGITYPVAIDNDEKLWNAFKNKYWPAHYFADSTGKIRFQHSGEGDYETSEKVIEALLMEQETGKMATLSELMHTPEPTAPLAQASGVEAEASFIKDFSPETYLGFHRQHGFSATPQIKNDQAQNYEAPELLLVNHWAPSGKWKIESSKATLVGRSGTLAYQFHARDVHLVLGHGGSSKAVKFKVTLNGKAPGANHGADTDADGNGIITDQRLYQLIRDPQTLKDQRFEIQFLDSGAEAYAFTFG